MSLVELAPYLIVVVVLIAASSFFSGTEVALFALRRVDREQLARSSRASDRLILQLLSKPDRLIATLLLGNEVVNVSLSAVMAGLCGGLFAGYDLSEVELALVTTFLALPLLLFFGEITPKTVAIKTSVRWAQRAARPLWLFGVLVSPIRGVVRVVARAILRPLGVTGAGPSRDFGEAEFKALVDAGSAEGQVDAHERRLIHRVFAFGDKSVGEVMLTRDQVFALSYDLAYPQLVREVAARGFSRVPIYQKSRDNVRGLVYAKDLVIREAMEAKSFRLQDILHPPLFVPQTTPVKTLFRIFKQRRIHMALVVNEYGKLVGLCTMEDLLEELFGEIHDEREERKQSTVRPRMRTESERPGRRPGLEQLSEQPPSEQPGEPLADRPEAGPRKESHS